LDAVDAAAAEIAYRVPLAAAADLVHHEARLLDQQCFDEWAELFTDDASYWMPDGDDRLLLARDELAARFPTAADRGEPITCRLVTDVHPEEVAGVWDDAPASHIVVGSTFSLAVLGEDGTQSVHYGWASHGLRRGEDRRLRIAAKKVVLLGGTQKTLQNQPFPL